MRLHWPRLHREVPQASHALSVQLTEGFRIGICRPRVHPATRSSRFSKASPGPPARPAILARLPRRRDDCILREDMAPGSLPEALAACAPYDFSERGPAPAPRDSLGRRESLTSGWDLVAQGHGVEMASCRASTRPLWGRACPTTHSGPGARRAAPCMDFLHPGEFLAPDDDELAFERAIPCSVRSGDARHGGRWRGRPCPGDRGGRGAGGRVRSRGWAVA